LNRIDVKKQLDQLRAVAIKADKTQKSPEIDQLLVELGNAGRVIPYYAIYPGHGGDPITFGGLITKQQVLDALEKAGPSR